jgi:hypothetical protein
LIAPLTTFAPRGSRFIAASFVVTRDEKHVPSILLTTAARDPNLIAPLVVLACLMARL